MDDSGHRLKFESPKIIITMRQKRKEHNKDISFENYLSRISIIKFASSLNKH